MASWSSFRDDILYPVLGAVGGGIAGFFATGGNPWGAFYGATLGAGIGYGAGHWDDFTQVPDAPKADASAAYSYGTPRNVYAQEHPVPLVYGLARVGGAVLYQGGSKRVNDFLIGLSEGPVQGVYDAKANDVLLDDLVTQGVAYTAYTGTASQNADPRFVTQRRLQTVGLTVWDYTLNGATPSPKPSATYSFDVLEDGATVLVNVSAARSIQDNVQDASTVSFLCEIKKSGDADWRAAKTYFLHIPKNELGAVETYFPVRLGAPATTATVSVPLFQRGPEYEVQDQITVGQVDLNPNLGVESPGTAAVVDFTAETFATGTHQLRLTFDAWDSGGSDPINYAWLKLDSVEVLEQAGAQALRYTAYLAATIPASQTISGNPTLTATVAGRNDVKLWNGSAWVNEWTNNPVWCFRDLLTSSRYGLGLAEGQLDDVSFKAAAAACDVAVSTLATGTASAGTTTSVTTGLTDGNDYSGYHLKDTGTGEVRRIYRYSPPTGVALVTPAFTNAMSGRAFSIVEPRFRFDMILDTRSGADEQLRKILSHCQGTYWVDAGLVKVDVDLAKATSKTLDQDVMIAGTFAAWQEAGNDMPDALIARYIDPDQGFEKRGRVVGTTGGRTDEREWLGCLNPGQAGRLAAYVLNTAQRAWRCSFSTTLASIALEPGDVVEVKHPVTGWGYNLANVDAPVLSGSGKLFLVGSLSDGENDTRTYQLREYDATVYSDTDALSRPVAVTSSFSNPFRLPEPCSTVTLTYLGDLTDDGAWNPEAQVEWTHPDPSGIAGYSVYGSVDNTEWGFLTYQQASLPYRWKITEASTTYSVRVIPHSVGNVRGSFEAAASASVTLTGDTVAPAIPSGLTVAFDSRAVLKWATATESDFAYWECTVDDFATLWRVAKNQAEVFNPSARSFTFKVRAVDRSGNKSGAASIAVTLPVPTTPTASYLSVSAAYRVVTLSVSSSHTRTLGHVGFGFRWKNPTTGYWVCVNLGEASTGVTPASVVTAETALETVTFELPASLFTTSSRSFDFSYCEVDQFGPSSWSAAKTVTITQDRIIEGIIIPSDATAASGLFSYDFAEPSDDGTSAGVGFAIGKNSAQFWGGSGGFNLAVGGPVWNSDGNYAVANGMKLKTAGLTKRYPKINSTNFEIDGQTHWYLWDTDANPDTWAELGNIGLMSSGGDFITAYFNSKPGEVAVFGLTTTGVGLWGQETGTAGIGVYGYASGSLGNAGQFDAQNASGGVGVVAKGDKVDFEGKKARITSIGGLAVLLTAGETLYEGELVVVSDSTSGNVVKCPTSGDPIDMPIGVVFADATSGQPVWVVVSGLAAVLPEAAVTATRRYVISASTTTAGRVQQASSIPSATQHWRECGHWVDSGSGNGVLTRAVLHFN
jgi:hypothetical protein